MLKLVPNELRESSYALGVPKYRTILRIVLPTATGGIVTGGMLAVARVAGETAPLLLTTFLSQSINSNPFSGPAGVAPDVHLGPDQQRHRRIRRARVGRRARADPARDAAQPRRPRHRLRQPDQVDQTAEQGPTTMAKRIDVSDLNVYYGTFLAVEGVSFTVEPRSITAFIGPSGCGKSTVLRTLNRMHEVIPGARVEGKVALDGEDIYGTNVDPVNVRRTIGMVFQKPNPFPTMSIYDNVVAGLKLAGRHKKQSSWTTVVERSLRGGEPVGGGQGPAEPARLQACPVVSSSGCASPARSPSSRRCCSWTSPARPSTRSRRWRSRT